MMRDERMQRAVTSLLLLMFLVTGVAGAALHLCSMEGLVLNSCGCHEEDEGSPVQLEPADSCCAPLISKVPHPPVMTDPVELDVHAPLLTLAFMAPEELRTAPPKEMGWVRLARGSPWTLGPPLFVWNCSYLN
jgi:hypothetical protein